MTATDERTRPRSAGHNRVSNVFWVLLAVFGASGYLVWDHFGNVRFGVFLFVISGWLVSLCLHEYAHARTALHSGDIGVGVRGYLTLNPLKYTHPVYSFLLPVVFIIIGGIALPGGAVFIDRGRIRKRGQHSLISAAGPAINALFAVACLLPLGAGWLDSAPTEFAAALGYLGALEVIATVLNLVPIPGLDGYGIIEPWLSYQTRRAFAPFAPYGMMAIFVLLWTPSLNQWFFTDIVGGVLGWFGNAGGYAAVGQELFRFWHANLLGYGG
ncbi:site-2 protease family protein [Phaeacidiphilus oryzae]|jgi:Zn-dependent protease|uniref:site-2 protease family protein n=1 Tax=Phaeacidiphilus oryzae TaxID=348818 RepID=UPI000563CD98|nr:site-2 protease family protein [Phaeacidiphilus oryzae]